MSRTFDRRRRRQEKTAAGARARERRRSFEREHPRRRPSTQARSEPRLDVRAALRAMSRAGRATLRAVPRAAWICAAIALLNAVAWSLITPPFQGRDEVDHFAYVAQLAETGRLPRAQEGPLSYSPQETVVMEGLRYGEVRFTPYMPSLATVAEQRTLMKDVDAGGSFVGSEEAGGASSEPPFFYALQTIPYALGGDDVLTKLQFMRLLDALLGGLTALLVFLFLREVMPGMPWAATVGAICAALAPQFAFVSGSLNPDALIYTISAAVFLCLARGFRRRLTRRLAIVLGALVAAGLVTYFSFIGVAAGAFAALIVLAVREFRARRVGREAFVWVGIAFAIGLAPAIVYALRNVLLSRPTLGAVSTTGDTVSFGSLFKELSYIWELYLPRLPGMTHYFAGISTWREVWFDRSVGLYGWMDTMFPTWVDNVALAIAIPIALLALRAIYLERRALRARLPELVSYAAIVVGVLVTIGVASYSSDEVAREGSFGEPRYLLPLLPLLAAILALAARGAGRRWMPVAGAALVVLFLGHDLFSQLQVIARYYG